MVHKIENSPIVPASARIGLMFNKWFIPEIRLAPLPGVTQTRPRQAIECGHFLGHLVEQAFDAGKTILAGDVVNQFVQEFPFRTSVPRGSTAFKNFCTRPLPLVKVPRFSAWAQPATRNALSPWFRSPKCRL